MTSENASSPGYSRSSSDELDHDRPERMRDWLIRMINSKKFPGLEYLDPEKTIFKVPWIHAKKRGYNRERDAALFKEWAVHSGKYRDESDPTVWKINFRCAINGLKDIVELKDLQTEDCRVYRILPRTRPPKRRRRPSLRSSTDPYPPYPVVTAAATTLMNATTSIPSAIWPANGYPIDQYTPVTSHMQHQQAIRVQNLSYTAIPSTCGVGTSPAGVSITENEGYYCSPSMSYSTPYSPSVGCHTINCQLEPCSMPTVTCSSSLPIRREESPDSGYGGGNGNGGGVIIEPSGSPIHSPLQSQIHSPEMHSYVGSPQCGVPSTCSVTDPSGIITAPPTTDEDIINIIFDESSPLPQSPPLTPPSPQSNQFNITVYYGTMPVISKDISCNRGCRLFYGPHFRPPVSDEQAVNFESIFGPLDAEQISLPPTHPLPQAKSILNSMNRGILIESHDNDIYVTPLCNNIVFCGTSYYQQSTPLDRERRTKVFDYNSQFRQALDQYSYRHGLAPDPHVIFSLGQPWGPHQPISQNYIFVVVTHIQAKRDLDTYGRPYPYATDLFSTVSDIVDVCQASSNDLRAESFLNSVFHNC